MRNFKPIEETAESVEKRMTFVQEFLQKKYGFGILFFVLIGFGIFASIESYNAGKEEGSRYSKDEITSLNNSLTNRNLEIVTLNKNITDYKKLYEDCKSQSSSLNLEDEVRKALEKSDRLEKLLELKISKTEKQTNEFNQIIKK